MFVKRKRRKLKPWIKYTSIILFSLMLFLSGYLIGVKNGVKVIVLDPKIPKNDSVVLNASLDLSHINGNLSISNDIVENDMNIIKAETLPETLKNASSSELEYLGEFLITGYCDCPICQEEWVGTTALGVPPTEEWTIAVDPDVIPLGSYVWIDGHRYRAEDVGGAINYNHIDMFMHSHEECYDEICNGYKDVYIEVES